jgi:hypothetical protein
MSWPIDWVDEFVTDDTALPTAPPSWSYGTDATCKSFIVVGTTCEFSDTMFVVYFTSMTSLVLLFVRRVLKA